MIFPYEHWKYLAETTFPYTDQSLGGYTHPPPPRSRTKNQFWSSSKRRVCCVILYWYVFSVCTPGYTGFPGAPAAVPSDGPTPCNLTRTYGSACRLQAGRQAGSRMQFHQKGQSQKKWPGVPQDGARYEPRQRYGTRLHYCCHTPAHERQATKKK